MLAGTLTESQFQSQVIDLAKKCGYLVYHTHDSRLSEPGFPDLVIVGKGRILYRELKKETGRISPAQKLWGKHLQQAGGDYAVWRPSDMKEIIKTLTR